MPHVPVSGFLTNGFMASLPSRPAAACPLEAVAGPPPALFPVLQNDAETFMSPEEANQTGNNPTESAGAGGRPVVPREDACLFVFDIVMPSNA